MELGRDVYEVLDVWNDMLFTIGGGIGNPPPIPPAAQHREYMLKN